MILQRPYRDCSSSLDGFGCGNCGIIWLPGYETDGIGDDGDPGSNGTDGTDEMVLYNDFTTASQPSSSVYHVSYSLDSDTTLAVGEKLRVSGIISTSSFEPVPNPSKNYIRLYFGGLVVFEHTITFDRGNRDYYFEAYITRAVELKNGNTLCISKVFTNSNTTTYPATVNISGMPYKIIEIDWDDTTSYPALSLLSSKYDTAGTWTYRNFCVEKIKNKL